MWTVAKVPKERGRDTLGGISHSRFSEAVREIEEKGDSMTGLIPRPTVFPEMIRLLEGGWPFGEHHAVRIEVFRDNGNFVLRAELPGMDPEKDIHIAVEGNELSITAERTVEKHDKSHSEFSYGSFARTIRLPVGAAVDKVSAAYDSGILEVTVPVSEPAESRKIPVDVTKKS